MMMMMMMMCYHYYRCYSYYMKGCVSWGWFFPHHYGPLLADMVNLRAKSTFVSFTLGHPFRPFQQLLGCLPSASQNLLPRPYQFLMSHPESPILDFYPTSFAIDMDGKKRTYEAVILLLFIDAERLKFAERVHCDESLLSPEEIHRNRFGCIYKYAAGKATTLTEPNFAPGVPFRGVLDAAAGMSSLSLHTHAVSI